MVNSAKNDELLAQRLWNGLRCSWIEYPKRVLAWRKEDVPKYKRSESNRESKGEDSKKRISRAPFFSNRPVGFRKNVGELSVWRFEDEPTGFRSDEFLIGILQVKATGFRLYHFVPGIIFLLLRHRLRSEFLTCLTVGG